MKARSAHLGINELVWTKHLLARCKLTFAIRVSGLTSRACTAAPFFQGRMPMPGGPDSETPIGSGMQQTPGPGITRRRATTDN